MQERRGDDVDPLFLDKIHKTLHGLDKVTKSHATKNKISKLDTIITAAKLFFKEGKYEEYVERVKVIADKLNDLQEESHPPAPPFPT